MGSPIEWQEKSPIKKMAGVAKVLKVFQFAQDHGVAQVNIRCGRIDAEIHAQRLAGLHGMFQLGLEVGFRNDFSDAFFQIGELFVC